MSYSFYSQPKGPDVNVSLFPDSYSKGVAAGNAEGSTLGSLVKGVSTGLNLYGKYQETQINEETLQQQQLKTESMQREANIQEQNAPVIEEAARVKANNALQEENKQAILLEQYQSLAKAATSGNKQLYADEVQSGKYSLLFGDKPELAKRAISDTFGYWNEANQKSYMDEIAARQRKEGLDFDTKIAKANYADAIKEFDNAFNAKTGGDNAGFVQKTELREVPEDRYKYDIAPNGTKTLKPKYDPTDPDYDPLKDKPLYQLYYKDTNKPVEDNWILNDSEVKTYSRGKNYMNLVTGNVAGQNELGLGDLEEKKRQAEKEKADLNKYAPDPVENGAPTATTPRKGNADLVESYQKNINPSNARFRELAKNRGNAMKTKSLSPTDSTQATPQDRTAPITRPIPQPTPEVTPTPQAMLKKMSYGLGGADVKPNFNLRQSELEDAYKNYDKINSLPGVADKPAIFKGLVTVESRGNPFAVSPVGAKGLTQLMPGTATEMGLKEEDVYNPELNAEAGFDYLEKQYKNVERALLKSLAEQAMPMQVDPRFILASLYKNNTIDKFALASYNGGFNYIRQGIAKGITSWDDMVEYLKDVKSEKAANENIQYVDKVLSASLPFIKGGNKSDDDYIKTLNNFGIITIT